MLLRPIHSTTVTRRLPASLFSLPVLLLLLTSCEKVIDLNLKGVEAKYVIEGTLSNEAGGCRVLISQTKDFDQNNDFPGVSGATVSIRIQETETTSTPSETTGQPSETADQLRETSDQRSNAPGQRSEATGQPNRATGESNQGVIQLTETAPGVYEAPSFAGLSGASYLLEVNIGDEQFTASSTMPRQINMDTLYVTEQNLFGEIWKLATINFPDPAGVENNYRFIQYINGKKTEQLYVQDDDLVDGREFETKLYMDPGLDEEERIQSGDSLKIEMRCIDAASYQYWTSLDQGATGNGSPITPANPVSNLRGGALGYFSAYTTQTKAIVVP